MPQGQGNISVGTYQQNIDAALVAKPSKFNNAYRSQLATYNSVDLFIDRMNLGGSVREDNAKHEFFIYPAARISLYTSTNSTVLTNGNLEVTLAVPSNVSLQNTYRVSEVVQDDNYVQGQIKRVGVNTLELEANTGVTWNASTHFVAGIPVPVMYNAQVDGPSAGMTSLTYTPSQDYQYLQIQRESHSVSRRSILKPTWATIDGGQPWSHFDIKQANIRYLKAMAMQRLFGQRNLSGTLGSPTSVTRSRGIREAIVETNPDLYFRGSSILDEAYLQNMITRYRETLNGTVTELMCFTGSSQMSNLQANILRPYLVTAGDNNTFGGVDVRGLNIKRYDFNGMTVALIHAGVLDDPNLSPISSITGQRKFGGSMFFLSPQSVPGTEGMIPPIVPLHMGPTRYTAGFINGIVDASLLTKDFIAGAQHVNSERVSDVDAATYYVYGDCGDRINASQFMLFEYAA